MRNRPRTIGSLLLFNLDTACSLIISALVLLAAPNLAILTTLYFSLGLSTIVKLELVLVFPVSVAPAAGKST